MFISKILCPFRTIYYTMRNSRLDCCKFSSNQDPPKSAWKTELEKKRREISKESWKKAFEKGSKEWVSDLSRVVLSDHPKETDRKLALEIIDQVSRNAQKSFEKDLDKAFSNSYDEDIEEENIDILHKRIVAERKKREAEEDKVFEEENYKERT